jgi:hypothetical protein
MAAVLIGHHIGRTDSDAAESAEQCGVSHCRGAGVYGQGGAVGRLDATSWRAEHAVRPTTVTGKVCGGNRTDRGAQTQSRMMTLFRTATQQSIDAVDYLVNLARAPDPIAVAFFT